MNTDFYRIKRLPPYIFEEVNRLKAQSRAKGEDIIDFGMGNPDLPTPDYIVAKLCETARDPRAHRYSASRGIKGLRKAHVAYYKRRFGVTLDPDREVIAALGSKEGFANLAMAITAPGDVVLVPNPAYPIHAFGFMIAGAAIRHVPATSPEEYLSKIGVATRHSVPSPLALVVNYPSNPSAQVVGLDFYKEVIKFAKKHEIWVLSDLAYADIYFGDSPPPSILEVDGAKDIAVEFQSLSKTYSMPGWRMGFAAGNEKLIGALARKGPDQLFISGGEAHAPARHGIGLGQGLKFDGDILGAVHFQDRGRRTVAEINVGIGQIAQHPDFVFLG